MFNLLEAPLQYLSTSYDTSMKPRILQRWIEATIYKNVESSKIWKLCILIEHNIAQISP